MSPQLGQVARDREAGTRYGREVPVAAAVPMTAANRSALIAMVLQAPPGSMIRVRPS